MNKIAFFTCNLGGYDEVCEPLHINSTIDYFYFTDGDQVPFGFQKVNVDGISEMFGKSKRSKIIKANPCKYIPNADQYDYIIWADSSFQQRGCILEYTKLDKGSDILTMKHPDRNCIYEEGKACLDWGIDAASLISSHLNYLKIQKYPENNGLGANGILCFKNTEKIKEFSETAELMIKFGVQRDQLIYNYLFWKIGITPTLVDFIQYGDKGKPFIRHKHLGKRA